ncbi:MAG: sigma-70 family RNA polymerase sigma factor [Deltaproteobacteria bacterium]|nr:sigma-70 family RNA polymerase sigma factor [Deltaproteobacteria bacterium]
MSILLNNSTKLNDFKNGDRVVFEEVYRTYVDDVALLVKRGFYYDRKKQFTVSGISDPQQQYDVIQEAFARAFSDKARQSYNGEQPYRLYLLRIVKNLMIDQMRKKGPELQMQSLVPSQKDGDPALVEVAFCPPNPAILAHEQKQKETVSAFVSGLCEEERNLYQKRYVLEFSQEKTAEAMQITRRRVRTLENRLRRNLKRHLKRVGLWP